MVDLNGTEKQGYRNVVALAVMRGMYATEHYDAIKRGDKVHVCFDDDTSLLRHNGMQVNMMEHRWQVLVV